MRINLGSLASCSDALWRFVECGDAMRSIAPYSLGRGIRAWDFRMEMRLC